MLKLRNLLESSFPNEDIFDDFQEQLKKTSYEFQSGQKHQSWRLVPKRLLDLVWLTYTKYGRVNERGLEKIWEIVKENCLKIIINSEEINGLHNYEIFGRDPDNEENESPITDDEWMKFSQFISDRSDNGGFSRSNVDASTPSGYGRYSDAHNRLFKLLEKVYKSGDPEQKLLAIDQILNFIHGIGYMAKWFVEGGVSSLTDLRDKDIKGIHLTGQLREETLNKSSEYLSFMKSLLK